MKHNAFKTNFLLLVLVYVENAILTSMVAPLSKEWKKKTHEFLPKTLRYDFKETLDELDKVCYSVTV